MHKRKSLVFLNSSAGELDWILPIIEYLLNNNFNIEIIYRTESANKSVRSNALLSRYLESHTQIKHFQLGWVVKTISLLGFYLYRIKPTLGNSKIFNYCFNILDKALNSVYARNLSKSVTNDTLNDQYLIFSEIPNLKKSLGNQRIWMERSFKKSIFFYCPHSPKIYSTELESVYPCDNNIIPKSSSYILLGGADDLKTFERSAYYELSRVVPVYTGHPKYSDKWISYINETPHVSNFNNSNNVVKILVISKGAGSSLTQSQQKSLVSSTVKVIHESFSNYQLIIKKHPRESESYWDIIARQYPSISFTEEAISKVVCKVDFSVVFWSTAIVDCYILGTPAIEFFISPNKLTGTDHPEQPGDLFKKFGLGLFALNEDDFRLAVDRITNQDYKVSLEAMHPFFQNFVKRANKWEIYFEKILNSNNIFLK
jgi:hypothetical protein